MADLRPERANALATRRRRRVQRRTLVGLASLPAAALVANYVLLDSAYSNQVYAGASVVAALTAGLGVWLNRLGRGWLLLFVTLASWSVGEVLWPMNISLGSVRIENFFYYGSYPLLIAAGLLLTTRGRLGLMRGALDAFIVGIGGGLLVWASLNGPLGSSSSYLEVLYPAIDLMVLTVFGQSLMTAGNSRSIGLRLAVAGGCVTLVADLTNTVEVMHGAAVIPFELQYTLWPLGYALFAWATLHPSARHVRSVEEELGTSISRQVTLGGACLAAMLALLVQSTDERENLEVFAFFGMALTFVVFLRMLLLFRKQRIGEGAMAAVFQHSLDGMLVTDDDRVYVDVNEAACGILGRPREEILGRRMEDVLGGEPAKVRAAFESFRAAGEHRGVSAVVLPDGRERRLDFVARANYLPGLHLSIVRDVTEQQELEERLRQSQKLEAIGQLAGGVAHDFNNLLTAISGYSELARSDLAKGNGRTAERLAEIDRAAGRAADLTRQLLAFGRRQILQPEFFDLNGVVSETDSMLRRLLGEHIRIVTSLDPSGCPITADRSQIEQVLVNLAVNARDAMPDGGTLAVETETDEKKVVLRVTDTGSGMDQATRDRAFEPFFTTKPVGKGTGLGLATVHGIVHQSGGTITVGSAPGVGTSFEIALPLGEPVPAETPGDGAEVESRATGERILLVEDEPVVRELASEMLRGQGYDVVAASDPEEALDLAAGASIDAVVTDVVMPKMNGRALAARLRDERPDLPVVYISGYADDATFRDGGLEAGAAFLQKPFGSSDLGLALREVLGAETPRRA